MKRIALALIAAGLAASAAHAGHDTSVSVSGTIHVGAGHRAPIYTAPDVYAPAPVRHVAPARGYWQEVVVKTWVPERWSTSRDRRGRIVRVCEPAHYAYRTERVWVDTSHGSRGHRGYGYNDRDHRSHWHR